MLSTNGILLIIISRYTLPEKLTKVVKIQSFVRRKLEIPYIESMKIIKKYFIQKNILEMTNKRRIFYTLSRQMDTELVQLCTRTRLELENLEK